MESGQPPLESLPKLSGFIPQGLVLQVAQSKRPWPDLLSDTMCEVSLWIKLRSND